MIKFSPFVSPLSSTYTCETRHDKSVKTVRNNYVQRPLNIPDAPYSLELRSNLDLNILAHGIYLTPLSRDNGEKGSIFT